MAQKLRGFFGFFISHNMLISIAYLVLKAISHKNSPQRRRVRRENKKINHKTRMVQKNGLMLFFVLLRLKFCFYLCASVVDFFEIEVMPAIILLILFSK